MKKNTSLSLVTLVLMIGVHVISGSSNPKNHEYEITTTWDKQTVPANEAVSIKFTSAEGGQALRISMKAPFYDDPMPNGTAGRTDSLWNHEVLEVFLLGDNAHYLELEFGPGGHYLVYYLIGIRNVENPSWLLSNYTATINREDRTWEGQAVIPAAYLPPSLEAFNAYAAHGEDTNRTYMALFPVNKLKDTQLPDTHDLPSFQPIDLSDLVVIRNSTRGGASSLIAANNASYVLAFVLSYLVASFVV